MTLVDRRVTADAAFPAAIGKRPPQIPRRRASAVPWPLDSHRSLTAAARYSSRAYGMIDNSDPVANTRQGFAGHVVADLRATVDISRLVRVAIGVDNANNAKYFLFHPFFTADLHRRIGIRL